MADLGGGAGALVRTSDPAALAAPWRAPATSAPSPADGRLAVRAPTDLQAVGDAALAAGLPVWELRRRGPPTSRRCSSSSPRAATATSGTRV